MKERPILFSAPMVRAILDGRKTQTRRIVKGDITAIGSMDYLNGQPLEGCSVTLGQCPFGLPGNRLWVRETTAEGWTYGGGNAVVWYRADGQARFKERPDIVCDYAPPPDNLRWRPSIHMPRWASRITLEITDVRVQRLQDVSQADAMAEGAPPSHHSIDMISRQYGYEDFSRSWYAQLWEQINGPGSWDANQWVWAITFRRVE